jgi:hypothetical protein
MDSESGLFFLEQGPGIGAAFSDMDSISTAMKILETWMKRNNRSHLGRVETQYDSREDGTGFYGQ